MRQIESAMDPDEVLWGMPRADAVLDGFSDTAFTGRSAMDGDNFGRFSGSTWADGGDDDEDADPASYSVSHDSGGRGTFSAFAKSQILADLEAYEIGSKVPEQYLKYMSTGEMPREKGKMGFGSSGQVDKTKRHACDDSNEDNEPVVQVQAPRVRVQRRAMVLTSGSEATTIRSRVAAKVNASAVLQHTARATGVQTKTTIRSKSKIKTSTTGTTKTTKSRRIGTKDKNTNVSTSAASSPSRPAFH